MQEVPVLMLTQDPAMWQHWRGLAALGWQPSRGISVNDLQSWRASGQQLVMLDTAHPELSAWQGKDVHKAFEGLKVLVLSPHPNDAEGQQVLARGACGYAHTHLAADELSKILKSIDNGAIWMGRSLLQKMLHDIDDRLPPPTSQAWALPLSQREVEAAQLAALGHSNLEIAQRLVISERTVRAHLSAVFEKLKVEDRLQLALKVHGIKA